MDEVLSIYEERKIITRMAIDKFRDVNDCLKLIRLNGDLKSKDDKNLRCQLLNKALPLVNSTKEIDGIFNETTILAIAKLKA